MPEDYAKAEKAMKVPNLSDAGQHVQLFSIGHSNQALDAFLKLLEKHKIDMLIDVRSWPYSRHVPQFNRKAVAGILAGQGIEYLFMGDSLGGRPDGIVLPVAERHEVYAHMARSAVFLAGLSQLANQLWKRRVAVMCAEEDPTHCHRRLLIGNALLERGMRPENICHIRKDGRLQTEAELVTDEKSRRDTVMRDRPLEDNRSSSWGCDPSASLLPSPVWTR